MYKLLLTNKSVFFSFFLKNVIIYCCYTYISLIIVSSGDLRHISHIMTICSENNHTSIFAFSHLYSRFTNNKSFELYKVFVLFVFVTKKQTSLTNIHHAHKLFRIYCNLHLSLVMRLKTEFLQMRKQRRRLIAQLISALFSLYG